MGLSPGAITSKFSSKFSVGQVKNQCAGSGFFQHIQQELYADALASFSVSPADVNFASLSRIDQQHQQAAITTLAVFNYSLSFSYRDTSVSNATSCIAFSLSSRKNNLPICIEFSHMCCTFIFSCLSFSLFPIDARLLPYSLLINRVKLDTSFP